MWTRGYAVACVASAKGKGKKGGRGGGGEGVRRREKRRELALCFVTLEQGVLLHVPVFQFANIPIITIHVTCVSIIISVLIIHSNLVYSLIL